MKNLIARELDLAQYGLPFPLRKGTETIPYK